MVKQLIITTLLFLFSHCFAIGQESINTIETPLSFREAVKLGLDNNVLLNQSKNQLESSEITKTSNLMQLGPQVSIGGNVGRNSGNSFNQQEGQVVNGIVDFTGATLRANMPLFQGFSQLNTYKASKHRLDAQVETIERTAQDVIQLVTTQFLQCLLDRELVRIAEQNLELQQKQYNQIEVQVEAGSVAKVDLDNQRFQLKSAELDLLRAKNTLRNDKVLLAQTLQLDATINFELEEPNWGVDVLPEISIDSLYRQALEHRPDYAQAENTTRATELELKSARGNYYPSVNAFFNYGSQYNYIHGFTNRTFDQQFFEDNVQRTYGVSFNIPIFGAFQRRTTTVQSKVAHENAKLDLNNTKIQVKSEVLLAFQNYQDALTAFDMTQAQLESGELSYQLESERYRLGISDFVQLSQANQDFVRAQVDYANARYTLLFQGILVKYAAGTLQYEDIP